MFIFYFSIILMKKNIFNSLITVLVILWYLNIVIIHNQSTLLKLISSDFYWSLHQLGKQSRCNALDHIEIKVNK